MQAAVAEGPLSGRLCCIHPAVVCQLYWTIIDQAGFVWRVSLGAPLSIRHPSSFCKFPLPKMCAIMASGFVWLFFLLGAVLTIWHLASLSRAVSTTFSAILAGGFVWRVLCAGFVDTPGRSPPLDHPSHRRAGGDGFTAETAEENAQETTESESGSSPPDPPDPLTWLGPPLCGLCGLCGETQVAISTVSAVRPMVPRWCSPRSVVFSLGSATARNPWPFLTEPSRPTDCARC